MSEQMNQMLSDSRLPLYEKAVVFAAIAHQGARRKGSRIPYLSHPIEAAAIVSELTDDEELIAAAVLHDVVEDTPVTLEEVEQYFGERIAAYVGYETEDKRRDLPAEETWLVRKQEMLTFLRDKADRNARILALADKLSNLRAIERDVTVLVIRYGNGFTRKTRRCMAGFIVRQQKFCGNWKNIRLGRNMID